MESKIWIASKPVPPSNYEHLYLVYDPDGNPNSGDEYIFRGGPQNNNPLNFGNIVIENWIPIERSEDRLNGDDPLLGRNYTELNLNVY